MIARVTLAEIDAVRMSVDQAVTLFRESVVPALREQEGYEGVYVLLSDEGKVLALTFWESEEAADAGIAGGRSFYAEQIEKFVTLYRSPPGREMYNVVLADAPAVGDRVAGHDQALRHPDGDPGGRPGRDARGRAGGGGRRRSPEPGVPAARHPKRRAAAGPKRAHRRRADARHRDHRGRARHGRHDDADDPLLGDLVARPDRRARGGARRDPQPCGPGRVGDRRQVLPRGRRRCGAAGCRRVRPRRRRRSGDHRAGRRAGSAEPPERASGDAVRERRRGAPRIRRDHCRGRSRGLALGASARLGVPEPRRRRQARRRGG